jgi:hypothetical protein
MVARRVPHAVSAITITMASLMIGPDGHLRPGVMRAVRFSAIGRDRGCSPLPAHR